MIRRKRSSPTDEFTSSLRFTVVVDIVTLNNLIINVVEPAYWLIVVIVLHGFVYQIIAQTTDRRLMPLGGAVCNRH